MAINKMRIPRKVSHFVGIAAPAAVSMIILVVAWQAWKGYGNSAVAQARNTRLAELVATMDPLNKTQDLSATAAAATPDLKWEQEFNNARNRLEADFAEAMSLSTDPELSQAVAQAQTANAAMVTTAELAMDLARRGSRPAARDLLTSSEYEKHKQLFTQGIEQVARHVTDRAESLRHSQQQHVYFVLAAGGTSVLLLLVGLVALPKTASPPDAMPEHADTTPRGIGVPAEAGSDEAAASAYPLDEEAPEKQPEAPTPPVEASEEPAPEESGADASQGAEALDESASQEPPPPAVAHEPANETVDEIVDQIDSTREAGIEQIMAQADALEEEASTEAPASEESGPGDDEDVDTRVLEASSLDEAGAPVGEPPADEPDPALVEEAHVPPPETADEQDAPDESPTVAEGVEPTPKPDEEQDVDTILAAAERALTDPQNEDEAAGPETAEETVSAPDDTASEEPTPETPTQEAPQETSAEPEAAVEEKTPAPDTSAESSEAQPDAEDDIDAILAQAESALAGMET